MVDTLAKIYTLDLHKKITPFMSTMYIDASHFKNIVTYTQMRIRWTIVCRACFSACVATTYWPHTIGHYR